MGRVKHTRKGMRALAMATRPAPKDPPPIVSSPALLANIRAATESMRAQMRHVNNYLMDLENWILEHQWPTTPLPEDTPVRSTDELWMKPHPRGPRRFEDPEWAQLVQEALSEEDGSITWDTYTAWCLGGGGDEWFVEQ